MYRRYQSACAAILARSHLPLERVLPLRHTLPVRFETPTAQAAWVKFKPAERACHKHDA